MPVLVTDEGSRYLEGRGMPVGLFPEAEYLDYEMTLPENFNLLLFSDGILEIMKESSLNDKEASLLRLTSASKGGLEQLGNMLGLNEDLEVPDDIAMASISRGKL